MQMFGHEADAKIGGLGKEGFALLSERLLVLHHLQLLMGNDVCVCANPFFCVYQQAQCGPACI